LTSVSSIGLLRAEKFSSDIEKWGGDDTIYAECTPRRNCHVFEFEPMAGGMEE